MIIIDIENVEAKELISFGAIRIKPKDYTPKEKEFCSYKLFFYDNKTNKVEDLDFRIQYPYGNGLLLIKEICRELNSNKNIYINTDLNKINEFNLEQDFNIKFSINREILLGEIRFKKGRRSKSLKYITPNQGLEINTNIIIEDLNFRNMFDFIREILNQEFFFQKDFKDINLKYIIFNMNI